ncbi:hypothetical protein IAT40_006327 [Kwoniella sp. CBS 6097]
MPMPMPMSMSLSTSASLRSSVPHPELELERLKRQYLALYPSYLIALPPSSILSSLRGQSFLLDDVLGLDAGRSTSSGTGGIDDRHGAEYSARKRQRPQIQQRQPEDNYRRKIWRRVVHALEEGIAQSEDEDAEVDERFYELLSGLMVSDNPGISMGMAAEAGPSTAPKTSYRTFIYDLPADHPISRRRSISTTAEAESIKLSKEREREITLLEEQIAIQGGTTGLRTWTAALHLGHHIIHHSHILFPDVHTDRTDGPDLRTSSSLRLDGEAIEELHTHTHTYTRKSGILSNGVIELGAGTGFLSVLLSQLDVDVIATDLGIESESALNRNRTDDRADGDLQASKEEEYELGADGTGETRTPLGRLKYNVSLNECNTKPTVRALDWTDASLPPDERPAIWKQLINERRTVIAADVIYDPDLVPPLVDAISTLIGPSENESESASDPASEFGWTRGVECIISATVRNQETFDKFLRTCESMDLRSEMIDLPRMDQTVDNGDPTFWDSALDAGTEVKIMRIRRAGR